MVSSLASVPASEAERRLDARWLLYLLTAAVYIFLFSPIVVVVIASFNPTGLTSFPPAGFTLVWYAELLRDGDILRALRTSLLVAVLAALLTSALAIAAAYGLSRFTFRFKRVIQAFFYLPILVPGVVAGIAMIFWFKRIGLQTGLLTILIAHVVHAFPYTLSIVLTSFYGFDRRLEEASQDLGANPWRTFWRVTLPLVIPGVVGGALLAFTVSFDEFVLTFFVAGGGVVTLPLEIYSRIRFLLSPVINAAAAVVLTVSMTLALVVQLLVLARQRRTQAS